MYRAPAAHSSNQDTYANRAGLFDREVINLLASLRMLDELEEVHTSKTGKVGVAYFSRRLLSKQPRLSLGLDSFRQIALRFARDDADSDPTVDKTARYEDYIRTLSSLIVSQCSSTMDTFFWPHKYPYSPEIVIKQLDLAAAAAYVGKLGIVQEVTENKANTHVNYDFLSGIYGNAARGGNISIIDHLFRTAKSHGQLLSCIWYIQLQAASSAGLRRVVEYLLNSKWNPGLTWNPLFRPERSEPFKEFHSAMCTRHVEIFRVLMRYKETTPYKTLTKDQLTDLLRVAAGQGWDDMAAHLLELGAPLDGYMKDLLPLHKACSTGSESVVRLLLQHDARITGLEIGAAAARGRLTIVRILLEHGANADGVPNFRCGSTIMAPWPPPIVSAVRLEQKEMFRLLVEHGADLGEKGVEAVKVAREEGLESMLEMLKEYNVNIEENGEEAK
jgi:hypothetical protein